jgi:hypothetical protein
MQAVKSTRRNLTGRKRTWNDEKATLEKPNSQGAQPKQKSRLAQLSLAALGVVFGDISTRPIYAIREFR